MVVYHHSLQYSEGVRAPRPTDGCSFQATAFAKWPESERESLCDGDDYNSSSARLFFFFWFWFSFSQTVSRNTRLARWLERSQRASHSFTHSGFYLVDAKTFTPLRATPLCGFLRSLPLFPPKAKEE